MPLFACPQCKTQLQVPEGMEGKQVRCSQCQGILQIPSASGITAQAPGPQPPLPQPGVQDMFDLGAGSAKSEVGQRRGLLDRLRSLPTWLLMAIGGGIFAVILVLLLVIVFWPSGGFDSTNLVYVPDDCAVVASVQVEEIRQSKIASELEQLGVDVDDGLSEMAGQLGLELDDIQTIILATSPKSRKEVKLARLKRSYTSEKILDSTWFSTTEYFPVSVAGHEIYEADGGLGTSFCVIDSYKVLYGSTKMLKKILRRGGPAKLSEKLQSAVDSVDFSSTFALAVDVEAMMEESSERMKKVELIPLTVAFDAEFGGNVESKLVMSFRNAELASDAQKIADAGVVVGKHAIDAMSTRTLLRSLPLPLPLRRSLEDNVPADATVPEEFVQIFNGMQVSASGNNLTIRVKADVVGILDALDKQR